MPGLSQERNGLLALLYAAQMLDSSEKKQKSAWETTKPYSRSHHVSESKFMKERKSLGSRCSHNELEKRRRGYLKECMELLKERLDFKNETSRITTLSVLKKAKMEILNTQNEIAKYEDLVRKEKLRSQMLSKRKFQCKKRIDDKQNSRRALTWRERNRNYSECSVNTTSSEESELDAYTRQMMASRPGNAGHQPHQVYYSSLPQRSLTPQQNRSLIAPRKHLASITEAVGPVGFEVASNNESTPHRPTSVKTIHSRAMVNINTNVSGQSSSMSSAGTSPSPMKGGVTTTDLFMDGSSSDSGYEEISSLTPPSTSECLSPMDLSTGGITPGKGINHFSNSIAKANQLIHQQAASAVFQGSLGVNTNGSGTSNNANSCSYWNSVSSAVF